MKFITNDELTKDETAKAETEKKAAKEADLSSTTMKDVASYLRNCWIKAKDAKERGIEAQILKNMTQIEGDYDAVKLAAIKEIGGSEVFMMITDAKCKNAMYWIDDILFRPGTVPFGVDPTPIPDLPQDIKAEIFSQLMTEAITNLAQETQASGEQLTPDIAKQKVMEVMPEIEKIAKAQIVSRSKEIAQETEMKLNDKLTEGGWYEALRKAVANVIMHTGFVVGPVMQMRKVVKSVTDSQSGKLKLTMEKKPIPVYESRHPLFIYPAPDSVDINDGYLFDRIKLTPIALQDLIDVPGYDNDEIMEVLKEAKNGKLGEWLQVDQSIRDVLDVDSMFAYDSDKIDCLRFWGYVRGEMLNEWKIKKKEGDDPIKDDMYYNVCAYMIGSHVISIVLNRDPLGRKPVYKCSFEERDGAFWGKGLPEVIYDTQTICNACARAIVNNVGIASGPQVERNVDRIPVASRADNFMRPWKVWDVTESTMLSPAPALKFYQPPMVVDKLMSVYEKFSRVADEHSGVPAFAHGDANVGGAGNTSSGLSMLMGAAARGIKGLVGNIDLNIISPSVNVQYEWLIENEDMRGFVCDYHIVTLGTRSALIKEQLASRRMEFLQMTANPIDIQLIGMEGRKYLLEETAESMSLDLTRVFKGKPVPPEPAPGKGGGGAEPPTASAQLDQAGNPVSGTDLRTAGQPPGAVVGPAGPPAMPAAPPPTGPMMPAAPPPGVVPLPNLGARPTPVLVPSSSAPGMPPGPPIAAPRGGIPWVPVR